MVAALTAVVLVMVLLAQVRSEALLSECKFDVDPLNPHSRNHAITHSHFPHSGITSSSSSSSANPTGAKAPGALFEPKQEHESMRAFNRRIKEQTRMALKSDMEVLQTSARKKDYLSDKKKRKKLKRNGGGVDDDYYDDRGNGRGHYSEDKVEFGEQAEVRIEGQRRG